MMVSREEIKSNILKSVVVRIDYADILEVKGLTDIQKVCIDQGLIDMQPNFLNVDYFQLNDSIPLMHYGDKYLEKIVNYTFMETEGTNHVQIDINQLFFEIKHTVVNKNYIGFDYILAFLTQVLDILQNSNFIIKRISIRKANEVFFDDKEKFKRYFKEDVLKFIDVMADVQEYNKSELLQNFNFNDAHVNLVRRFDKGHINSKKYFRLYLDMETYLRGDKVLNTDIVQKLIDLNVTLDQLFVGNFTEEGIRALKAGERIGDI